MGGRDEGQDPWRLAQARAVRDASTPAQRMTWLEGAWQVARRSGAFDLSVRTKRSTLQSWWATGTQTGRID